jgi:hypothetical protein
MHKSHYFLSPVLIYDGPILKRALNRALVSRTGVYKAFEESEETQRAFLEGRAFRAKINGTEIEAYLVRESGPGGTHFNLRVAQHEHLQSLLLRYGFESPWRREFARIPAAPLQSTCEVPVGAFLGKTLLDVRNFSYHGLFLEGASQGEAVGQKIRFRLVTNKGKALDEATGRVARVYDEMVSPAEMRRGFGIRLLEMSERTKKVYYGMILDACRELQGRL